MSYPITEKKTSNFGLISLGLIIALGNCCIGYTGVCLSAIQHILKSHNKLSENQTMYHLSISTSSLNLGAILGYLLHNLGALFYKKFQNKFGTLKSFTIIDILCIFFLSVQIIDLNIYYLAIGRFMYGIFMTMSLAMTPNFLNQLSKTFNPSIHGTLGSFNQLLIVFGMIAAYIMAYILPKTIDNSDDWAGIKWRIYIGLPIIFILIRLKAVQSQSEYKLVQKQLYVQSSKCIASVADKERIQTKAKLSYRQRLIVGILVIASNQLSCINGIFFYARQMMDMVTDKNQELSKILMLFLAFGQLLACLLSGKLLNKYGRKFIFIKGQQIIVFILVLCFFLDINNPYISLDKRHFILGILINLHVIVFNLTLGPICIFYCSQILDDLKYVVLTLKFFSLFFALTSDIMIHTLGIGEMFMIFGIISLIACIYLDKFMKETANLDKQKIYDSFISDPRQIITSVQPEVKPLAKEKKKQCPNNEQLSHQNAQQKQHFLKPTTNI